MRDRPSRSFTTLLVATLAVPPGLAAGPPAGAGAAPGPAIPTATETTKPGPANPPPSIPAAWWSRVQTDLRDSEYGVTWQEHTLLPDRRAAYQAPNRAQNLRTYFTAEGIICVPRSAETPWQVGLRLVGIGGGDRLVSVGAAQLEVSGNRVEYRRDGLVEWYVNDERGLEQGFSIERRPVGGQEPLRVALGVSGNTTPRLAEQGRAVEFLAPGGVLALRYAGLTTTDALGKALASRMELSGCAGSCAVHLVVEDAGAAYPLTIDPLATSPDWTVEGDQAGAHFGTSVGAAGDVNGDGYADVIVGAPHFDNGQTDEGRAYVYHGSVAGLSVVSSWMAEGNQADASFGQSVGTAGDVNGDGHADVIVGAHRYDHGQTDEGRAYVYHGSAWGLAATPSWTGESQQADALFGFSVGPAGDVNGDGYADVIVGAHHFDNGQTDEGRVYVYHGSAAGLSLLASWTAEGSQADARFGTSVGTAGDVNRDGYADVIVGAARFDNGQSDEGRAHVYHGSAAGLSATPSWTAESDWPGAFFAESVGAAGDVNGDGYADVVVGALLYTNEATHQGRAYVYHGSASGLLATPSWMVEGDHEWAWLGDSVSTVGDVNGDGYADVIVGAPEEGPTLGGRAYVYHGSASGLLAAPSWTADADGGRGGLGGSVGMAGDVNGDGYADVIVGAPYSSNGQPGEGRAYAYHGSASGLMPASSWMAESNQVEAAFGTSVGLAGDVNGDGYSDVIVGAPRYDNGQTDEGRAVVYHGSSSGLSAGAAWTAEGNLAGASFGLSVMSAGDVNGDGYADVIVGAPYDTNGQSSEGRTFVYHGSASGLSPAAAWTAEGDQALAYFGWRVGTAGDVNGDGYADVIVGAVSFDGGEMNEGRAYVFHGSASGLLAAPSWTAESNQASAHFGMSVGTAGDVNGDGYADVIVGAYQYENGESVEGRAYLHQGSASGLSLAPNWTAESNQVGARFGSAVGTAGDVDEDGYADVLVGAPYYDNGQTDEGRVYVYHGSATGLSGSSWRRESHQAGARFGSSVGTAGDVNGDGYADVVVGAPYFTNGQTDEGRTYAYHGSASGLGLLPSWIAESDQAFSRFGGAVGTAGDVNGDGFADVLVGASSYDGGQTDEGRALLYHGNADGALLRLRQIRSSGTTVQPWGASWASGGFQTRMTCAAPFGLGRVRLQVEACPNATPFGDPACSTVTSAAWAGSGTSLAAAVPGLTGGALYRWRARTLHAPYSASRPGITAPPNPAHGPWRRLFGQAVEADVRILDPGGGG